MKVKILKNRLIHIVLIAGIITIILSGITSKLATAIVFLSVLMLTALFVSQKKYQFQPFIAGFSGTLIYNVALSLNMGLPLNISLIYPALQVGIIASIIGLVIKK